MLLNLYLTDIYSYNVFALSFLDDNVNIVIFQRCLQSSILEQDKRSVFSIIQAEFDKAKGDVDSKRIFLDQSFRDCVTSDSKLDMDKYSDLVQLSIKGKIAFDHSKRNFNNL